MSKTAFIFPGQASQYPGMGRELAEKYEVAREVFAAADRALTFSISRLCFEGPEEELQLTANTQPAILTCSVAAFRILVKSGMQPDYVAGHSLGEYSALVAAGALSLADAVVTVRKRGTYMQEAVPVGAGAMAAILGVPRARAEEICAEAAEGEVLSAANVNSGEQIVIAGTAAAVARAVELAPQRGAKRAVLLPVSAPFHCDLMRPAQERLATDLQKLVFANLRYPLVTNVDVRLIESGAAARDALIRQVTAPVRWEESMRFLISLGVRRFVEVGPGKVLTGLLRQIDRRIPCWNVEDEKSLQATLEKFRAGE